jgi:hypothetical protein
MPKQIVAPSSPTQRCGTAQPPTYPFRLGSEPNESAQQSLSGKTASPLHSAVHTRPMETKIYLSEILFKRNSI